MLLWGSGVFMAKPHPHASPTSCRKHQSGREYIGSTHKRWVFGGDNMFVEPLIYAGYLSFFKFFFFLNYFCTFFTSPFTMAHIEDVFSMFSLYNFHRSLWFSCIVMFVRKYFISWTQWISVSYHALNIMFPCMCMCMCVCVCVCLCLCVCVC